MKRLIALLLLSAAPATVLAQVPSQASQSPSKVPSAAGTSGQISAGPQLIDNNTNSSKYSEYRDLGDNRFPVDLRLNMLNKQGLFLDLTGANLTRRDRTVGLSAGDLGLWRLDVAWDEIPHNFSNKAMSPYFTASPGLLNTSQAIAMPFKRLGTTAAQIPQVLQSDTVIASYAQQFARPIDLGTQSKWGTVGVRYNGVEALDLSAGYTLRTKTGQHLGYGPIGDRPPRTLNIQFAEPVDYQAGDLRVGAEYDFGAYQVRADYLFSDFRNDIDALVWRNVYATPVAGADIDTWQDRLIPAFGRKALAPDNTYQSATVTGGATLPMDSRLTASVSLGRWRQNETLLPYGYPQVAPYNDALPRATADARMNTSNVTAEYAVVPIKNLNLRAFFRRFDLNNETPSSQWWYVTSDVPNSLTGTRTFLNKRVSEPIAWDRQNIGLDASWRLSQLKSTVGVGFEREDFGRERREVEETNENILRANWRVQPTRWFSLRTKYLRGDRDGGVYDWKLPRESYWYTQAEAGTDNNNPQFTFENHPDMRRFDISDRKRDQIDVRAGFTPIGNLAISTTFRYRHDDFDSDVQPEQPLIDLTVADRLATTPGDQLGLLNSQWRQIGLDVVYAPTERLNLNAAFGWDAGETNQRGLEFNENNKQNPSAVATATLGPWTRASSEWTARTDDNTRYFGLGGSYDVRANITLSGNYTFSLGKQDLDYAGFGLTNFDGTPLPPNHEFGFSSPPTVRHKSQVGDIRLEFPLPRNVTMRVGYMYDYYRISDWQQESATPQFESVVTDLLLRDTSRSQQWGNRLFNTGTYLSPFYTAHLIHASLAYHF